MSFICYMAVLSLPGQPPRNFPVKVYNLVGGQNKAKREKGLPGNIIPGAI
jgi:hypothetical protein